MTVLFDREKFFNNVRASLFSGTLSQQQVDGMNFKIDVWEDHPYSDDLRWLAYCFATSYHETSQKMWPVEEYGKGSGMAYGNPDPTTGQTYYGRGDVQLTWAENYQRATVELGLVGENDLAWHASKALDPKISADVMYIGMVEGWFRASSDGKQQTLARYFYDNFEDAYGAREIINGDKKIVPSWSNGVSIGNLVADYYDKFLIAFNTAFIAPAPPAKQLVYIDIDVVAPPGVEVKINITNE